ncbi:BTAD domain-containing putative transcriptional regulator [Saccharopolyspora shandongensis]|uniref:BTAD domain-containing putative transcriptional regulator n=1 Tax=Saccharopolyspora shandongensis TaxID=418495 RepID=UPI003447F806
MSIIRQGPGYYLRIGSARFDLHEFEHLSRTGRAALQAQQYEKAAQLLRSALDLWRGPTLTDVTELLAEMERPRIEEARMEALEARIDADLALGRHDRLTAELVGLVNAHPLRERIRAQFMIALYRCDRQAEAFATYQEGRRLLGEEFGVDPSETLKSAYQTILTNDLPRVQLPSGTRESLTTTSRPAMLATGIPDFSGRSDELDLISRFLRPEPGDASQRPPALVITGMAGIGKTTLAVHTANLNRENFPDGELFVDLQGGSESPLTPYHALGTLLCGLGVEEHSLPTSTDHRIQLYRSTLAHRQSVIVLDDAADVAQIRPLLPANPKCRTLITTRPSLTTLEGQRTINLGFFDFGEANALFARIVGDARVRSEPVAARQIVEFCAGLPLAVRIAGARLATKQHWSLSRFAARLADERSRLSELQLGDLDVRERLERSYRLLDEQPRTALLQLSLLDQPSFPHSATSTVLGLSDVVGEQITEHLLDLHLLELAEVDSAGQHTYRFHDLARLVARELAHDEAFTASRQKPSVPA